ncbi:hypothetical protein VNO77_46903 [Canavalia gladiata]|uniref:Uncharacterized protein n=1 Tax=Canavalia gladiata TaxID=3824 RepID=A0AAN9PHD8_CANGL
MAARNRLWNQTSIPFRTRANRRKDIKLSQPTTVSIVHITSGITLDLCLTLLDSTGKRKKTKQTIRTRYLFCHWEVRLKSTKKLGKGIIWLGLPSGLATGFRLGKRKTGPHVMRFRKQRVSPIILFESLTKPVPRVPFANYTANATGHKDKVKQLLPFLRIGHGISNRPLSGSPDSGLAGSFLDTESTSLGRPRHPSVRNVGHLGKSTYLAMLLS